MEVLMMQNKVYNFSNPTNYKLNKIKIEYSATKIQKIWKGKRNREILNNIYIKLPIDIQLKIIFYIRKNYLIKKHHYDVIEKIIYKKVNYYFDKFELINKYNLIPLSIIYEMKKLIYIYIKYFKILKFESISLVYEYFTIFYEIIMAQNEQFYISIFELFLNLDLLKILIIKNFSEKKKFINYK